MTTFTLPPEDLLCFHCPIPPPRCCNEHDRRCLRKQALEAEARERDSNPHGSLSKRKHNSDRVTNYLKHNPGQHRAVDIASALRISKANIYGVLAAMRAKKLVTRTGHQKATRWTAKPSP